MISVAFYHHGNLVEREVITHLKQLPNTRVVVINIASFTTKDQAVLACEVLKKHECNVLFTINDWGLDADGYMADYMLRNHMVHVNWYVDDPFYYETMAGMRFPPRPNRLDFVTDRGYCGPLVERGYQARFLPLATDISVFHPVEDLQPVRDVCFVGNSYREETDKLLGSYHELVEQQLPFLGGVLGAYTTDMRYDVEREIDRLVQTIPLPQDLSVAKAAFIMKHFVGYLFRKRLVVSLAQTYPDFMAFGDQYWVHDLPAERVSMAVGYYTNLSQTYQQTRVNLDINRMVIRDGFTQRIFDCLASGAFVITSPKRVVHELFVTKGPEKEVEVFQNEEHLRQLIDYYISHEDERTAIARRGRNKVLQHHTYRHRLLEIFSLVSDLLRGKQDSRRTSKNGGEN